MSKKNFKGGSNMKQWKLGFLVLFFGLFVTSTVFASQYYNSNKTAWVKNEEKIQLYYKGTAYTKKGSRAQITYYRNGAYLGGAYAYLDSWRTESSITDTCTIWDSLNPVAAKTTWYYSF